MDSDAELIEEFVAGARTGGTADLHVEGDALYLNAWWHTAFRLAPDAYLVRDDPPPVPTDVVDRLTRALRERGLAEIPGEHPLIEAVTYAELSVVGVDWAVWAPDARRAEEALGERAAPEDVPETVADPVPDPALAPAPGLGAPEWAPGVADDPRMGDLSAQFARSLVGGMPPSVILAVGLGEETVAALRDAAPACRVEPRGFDDAVAACGALVPHVVVVDATGEEGRRFLLEFRAEACGRHVPVAAVTEEDLPRGADTVLDPRRSPSTWEGELVQLLP